MVEPRNLKALEGTIRERAGHILDSLPENETFNWVDLVSVELTTQMLATLFGFPFEERSKLTRWSDVATGAPITGIVDSHERQIEELQLRVLWEEIMKRFHSIEVVGEPVRTLSAFVKGYTALPVRVHRLGTA